MGGLRRYTATLIEHVEQIGGVCKLCFELEPDLGVLAVDFMSTDYAGHLGFARFDPAHPAHDPAGLGRRAGAGLPDGRPACAAS